MIDRDHQLSITRQASLLNISRGTVYYLPRPVSPVDLALMRRLDELHLEVQGTGVEFFSTFAQRLNTLPATGPATRVKLNGTRVDFSPQVRSRLSW